MNRPLSKNGTFLSNLLGMQDELNQLIKNNPLVVALMAVLQAVGSDSLLDILNKLDELFPGQNVKRFRLTDKWIKFYRFPSLVTIGALNHIFNHVEKDKALGQLLVTLYRSFSVASKEVPELNIIRALAENFCLSDKKAIEVINFFQNIPIDDWEAHFNGLPDVDYSKQKFKPVSEIYFFLRVKMTCIFFYGENPEDLFLKAQSGDVDSICKLLKLDKAVIQDRKINRYITKYSLKEKGDEFEQITRAIAGSAKITKLQKAKTKQAAMISAFAKSIGTQITAPDIQYIYDIVHRAKTDGYTPDPHLPSPEAFAKTIQRKTPIYLKVFSPDKK